MPRASSPAPAGPLTLRVLGSRDAFGSGGRFQTCLLLEGAGRRLLVDCGTSSLIAMRRAGVDPASIDGVVLSHLHDDHFGGLPFLVLDGQFSRRTRPPVVGGPPGVAAPVTEAIEVLFPGSSGVERRFATEFQELPEPAPVRFGSATVTAFPVEHPSGSPAFALRVRCAGCVVAYSGDTQWTESLIDAAHEADLFVAEAYTFERCIRYHLDYATLRSNLGRLACRRVILTHLGPDMLARHTEADLEVAEDGLTVEV
jgi:ribonuclease BN (tRNA processing enzyme)